MNIALIGYGKMGKTIESIALKKGHTITFIIDSEKDWAKIKNNAEKIDVAIDFSTPQTIINNINRCFDLNIPIVVGTTGWYENINEIKNNCLQNNKSLIWASNFSIGVNIFFKINKELAKLMNTYNDYDVIIEETHHCEKLDKPSGTAITLASDILENINRKQDWKLDTQTKNSDLIIKSKRIDPVPGTHTIIYESSIDKIEITHEAKSRTGFAIGAITAAEWLQNKTGWYEFKNIL